MWLNIRLSGLSMEKVVALGGSEFIGNNICGYLIKYGYNVISKYITSFLGRQHKKSKLNSHRRA